MADDLRLGTYTTEAQISVSTANNCGNVESVNSTWSTAKAGSSESQTANNLTIRVAKDGGSGSSYTIKRTFLNFLMPSNLSRLDNTPQLKIRVNSLSGDAKVFITSIDYTNATRTWSAISAANAWDSVQTGSGAIYYMDGSSEYATVSATSVYVTLDLNELARFHCFTKPYVTIALINYTYDRQNSATATTNQIVIDDISDAKPPLLVLRKPWFMNDRGDEFPVASDYTIRAFDVGVNQRDRSVPQLPFSTAIKGPAFLRGKNSSYKVTT
tara:strand:+ start:3105 stop:3914 length:810 start_codon:yes stop_codon:yes gene_type:complete